MLTEEEKEELKVLTEMEWGDIAASAGKKAVKFATSDTGQRMLRTGARYGLRKIGQSKWAKKHKLGSDLRSIRKMIAKGSPHKKSTVKSDTTASKARAVGGKPNGGKRNLAHR